MIEIRRKIVRLVFGGYPMDQNVMDCLNIEGLLNLGVWGIEEMN